AESEEDQTRRTRRPRRKQDEPQASFFLRVLRALRVSVLFSAAPRLRVLDLLSAQARMSEPCPTSRSTIRTRLSSPTPIRRYGACRTRRRCSARSAWARGS